MKIVCIDDEKLILNMTVTMCRELPEKPEVVGFSSAEDALDYFEDNTADIALLDINMPNINGIMLAARLKELDRDLAIIFLTGHAEYALEAFSLHAAGYLLKPINQKRLAEEIRHAAEIVNLKKGQKKSTDISIHTFGNFEVIAHGEQVEFARSKAKEALAYLVDLCGDVVSRPELFSALWEGKEYDRSMQKQLDVVLRSLRATLEQYGISHILQMSKNGLRVVPENFDCDLYRLLEGDADTVNTYRGEYMTEYSWASMTEGKLYNLTDQ